MRDPGVTPVPAPQMLARGLHEPTSLETGGFLWVGVLWRF